MTDLVVIRCSHPRVYTSIVPREEFLYMALRDSSIELLGDTAAHVAAHTLLFPQGWSDDTWGTRVQETRSAETRDRVEREIEQEQRLHQDRLRREGKRVTCHPYTIRRDDGSSDDLPDTIALSSFPIDYHFFDALGVHTIDFLPRTGDIIDTDGFRGIGLWYCDGTSLIKTQGEYGYFLPSQAYKKVEEHGLEYFAMQTGAEFVLLPATASIKVNGEPVHNSGFQALVFQPFQEDTINIDGRVFDKACIGELY